MQFLILAYDGEDEGALNRRQSVRAQHIALSNEALKRGEQLVGAALLDDGGSMKGSVMIVDFPSRSDVDTWLKSEPYVVGNVWQKIDVIPCKIGPSFEHLLNVVPATCPLKPWRKWKAGIHNPNWIRNKMTDREHIRT